MYNKTFYILALLLFSLNSCSAARHHHHHPVAKQRERLPEKEPCKPTKKTWVMIDPGHGGEDFGTHSLKPPRYQEKYLNLSTAYMLKGCLQQMGYKTTLTRHNDTFISLGQRAALANSEKPTVFVSVHYNSAPSTQAEGVEVFFYRSNKNIERTAQSKKLAELVLNKILAKTQAKSRGVKHGDFAVIRETTMPAILIEGGFLTNENEMGKLRDPAYLKKVATGIAEGVHQYIAAEIDTPVAKKK